MYTQAEINNIVENFVKIVSENFNLREAYLFGSYANGLANEYSDIDIALVSDEFEGSRFWDKKKLYKYLLKLSSDIEIHPFNSDDFNDSDPFVVEIKRTGKKIL